MSDYMRNRKTLSSVADAYREMYATPNEDILNEELIDSLIEDARDEEINEWLEYLDEVNSVMSVDKKNMPKAKPMIQKLARARGVPVSFDKDGINVTFKGRPQDVDKLMKDFEKNKTLMKLMESDDLDESKGLAAKSKKSGISVGTLRKVYNRGMAAWKTGHRPGTTPQQWGMARVNAFIVKKKKGNLNHDKDLAHVIHPDDDMMNEVKRQEVDAMKKVSKDMQKVLVSYQKIANMGDKELKNTVHNKSYKQVLDARDTILKMIGTLNTKMLLQKEEFELVEASAGEMIDKLFNLKGNKDAGYGVAKLLSMTGVKVIQAMQKQNPQGFMKTVIALGKEKGKMRIPTNNALMKMFKQQGVKPLPEELDNDDKPVVKKIVTMLKKASKKHAKQAGDLEKAVSEGKGVNRAQQAAIAIAKKKSGKYDKDGKKIDERVKDGKLDPLSKMGKSKLTGQEINRYYRENPKQKAAARDKTVKKAIELALDLSGATNYAIKEIEKLKKGLSKLPAVKLALRHANESKEFTGHHVVIEQLSPANMVKLKTYGKMMAKMTKLPFDEKDPEKGIDKLMGQVWKQKHVPANWERLHKMVMMLKGIGVKMPSLKGKYMGLDPVSKKAIFYKEGTDEMVEWHQKIDDIKEGIEELVEKKEMSDADIKKIEKMTDRNDHTGSLMHLAKLLGDRKGLDALKGIMMTHKALGHMPEGLMKTRNQIYDNLMRQSSSKYSNHNDVISSF